MVNRKFPNTKYQSLNLNCVLLAIVGPTASGKTALSIETAKKYDGEIICADSRTVYKGMDVGTAKPTPEERAAAPHHLLDIVYPDEPFTVADFKDRADTCIADIQTRGKLPILVGGSGLYIDAVIYNFNFSEIGTERDPINPRHANVTTPKERDSLPDGVSIIGINPGKELIKALIKRRIEEMISTGFIDEVRSLYAKYPHEKALLAPGYKAFSSYVDGTITLEEAKQLFIRNDSQLAKRQLTWFKRNADINWFEDASAAGRFIDSNLASSGQHLYSN